MASTQPAPWHLPIRTSAACLAVAVLVLSAGIAAARQLDQRRILALHSGQRETPAIDPFEEGTRSVFHLAQGQGVEYYSESLEIDRDHRAQVIGGLAVVALQTLLIGGLLLERRRRQRAQVESRHYLATMAHLDRRAAMGELTASLAHELHQPLGAILRNAEAARMLLASGTPPMDEIREIVEDIRKDDKRAAEIIGRMRTLLRKREIDAQAVDLNAVALETVEFIAPDAASKGVPMEVELPRTPCMVTGDRVHLQQVVLNLVLNGVDAMTRTPHGKRRLVVRTTRGHGQVEVSVRDAGCGIAPDAFSQVFEPFFTTRPDGMGMGLSIARSIVEAHGGRIAAANNADGGATVRFTLPLRKQEATGAP